MPSSKENENADPNLGDLTSEASKSAGQEEVFHFVKYFANTLYVWFTLTTFLFRHYVKQVKSDLKTYEYLP